MPSSKPLHAHNSAIATSGASQPPPQMKQPMSRISSMRRDWNDEPQPSQSTQSKVDLSQDTDTYAWSRSPSPEPKPKAKAPLKATTVSRQFSDKSPSSTTQWKMYVLSGLIAAIVGSGIISGLPPFHAVAGKTCWCDDLCSGVILISIATRMSRPLFLYVHSSIRSPWRYLYHHCTHSIVLTRR